jgi:hypothetical protein
VALYFNAESPTRQPGDPDLLRDKEDVVCVIPKGLENAPEEEGEKKVEDFFAFPLPVGGASLFPLNADCDDSV